MISPALNLPSLEDIQLTSGPCARQARHTYHPIHAQHPATTPTIYNSSSTPTHTSLRHG